ncbi:uncharacterized protein LOC119328611 isoform X2 [Triticum dicoccoides]|nr:uncharacterized protein LOC119328611 isoform X2 [Triticum dicoccoides]
MRSSASRGPYPPQLVRKPREEEINRAFAGRRRRKCADASQGGRSTRLRCAMSAAAASASTLLRVAACVRKHGQATTSKWHRRQQQHTRCDGRGLPVGIQGWRARWLGTHAPDAQEVYASEHAGGNVHREVPEQPSQYRAPPYWTDPATPSSPPLTGLCRFPQQHCLQLSHFPGSAYKVQTRREMALPGHQRPSATSDSVVLTGDACRLVVDVCSDGGLCPMGDRHGDVHH